MTYTEASKRATMKYIKNNLEEIRIRAPKGTKTEWKKAAEAAGVSLPAFIKSAVEAAILAQKPQK